MCATCRVPLTGKRPHAVYCSRSCKTKASDQRRLADGRSIQRDRSRYEKERDHRRQYARQQYRDQRNAYIERSRRWRRDNPGLKLLQEQLRRARKNSAGVFQVSVRDWDRLVARYGGCAYCGKHGPVVIEHVIPLSRGGRHSIGNLLPACQHCNASKGALLLVEWRARR